MVELRRLSSDALLAALHRLVDSGRMWEAALLEHIGEVDARRLYLREACASMYSYCVEVLHFSEAPAFKRVGAARAARSFPELLHALRTGELHVTGMRLLAPHLSVENTLELLELARHRTGKEIQALLADREPKPDVVVWVRRSPSSNRGGETSPPPNDSHTSLSPNANPHPALPAANTLSMPPAFAANSGAVSHDDTQTRPSPMHPSLESPGPVRPRPMPEPLGGDRYLVRFTATAQMYAQLRELQALMRHQIPDGDLTKILARALSTLLAQVRKQKFGECAKPRELDTGTEPQALDARGSSTSPASEPKASLAPSRQIPAAIRRAVSARDEDRCTYVSPTGRRCSSRTLLEFHHLVPWAIRPKHEVDGITLRCRAHNQYEAEREFGAKHMARFKKDAVPEKEAAPRKN